jgi:hypothetical protein
MVPRSGPTTSLLHVVQYAEVEDRFLIQQHRIPCKLPLPTNTTISQLTFRMTPLKFCEVDSEGSLLSSANGHGLYGRANCFTSLVTTLDLRVFGGLKER